MGRLNPVRTAALAIVCFAAAAAPAQNAAGLGKPVERFAGVYQLSGKRLIYIQPWPGGEASLSYLDETGQLRALFPDTVSARESTFVGGPGLLVREPVELGVTFIEDSKGKVTGLVRKRSTDRPMKARKLDSYWREEVSFRSGSERLTGVVLTPPGRGVHPALVLIGGTGAADRNTVLPITQFLLAHGVALLGYDQRGVGGSTGDWRTASLNDFAQDVVAAAQVLKSRKEIDPKRIGVFGASQGGWVAPLAAVQSRDIAFVISVVICFLFILSGFPLVLNFFQAWAPQILIDAIASFSFLTHFEAIRKGVIDLRDLIYFGVLIVFWLYATVVTIEAKKAG